MVHTRIAHASSRSLSTITSRALSRRVVGAKHCSQREAQCLTRRRPRTAILIGGAVVGDTDDGEGGAPRLLIARKVGLHLGLQG